MAERKILTTLKRALNRILVATILLIASPLYASTHLVKPDGTGDYPTIQIALDASAAGDTVLLGPGTYFGPVNGYIQWPGRPVTMCSQEGPEHTVIRYFDIYISDTGSDGSVLEGVTIRDSWQWAVLVNNRDAIIRNCIFEFGKWIWLHESSSTIEHCLFRGMTGIAIAMYGTTVGAVIQYNVFTDNDFVGALVALNGHSAFVNNTVVGNRGTGEAAAVLHLVHSAYVANNIIANTTGAAATRCYAGATPIVTCNNIYGNAGDGVSCGTVSDNFSADAQFCDGVTFGLRANSACAPGNSPCGALVGAVDVSCGECPGTQVAGPGQASRINLQLYNTHASAEPVYYIASSSSGITFVSESVLGNFASLLVGSNVVDGYDTATVAVWARVPEDASPGDTLAFSVVRFGSSPPVEIDTCLCATVVASQPVGVESPPSAKGILRVSPTPFGDRTLITYGIESAGFVELSIYDVNGRRVRKLLDRTQTVGQRSISWDGTNDDDQRAASGVYFVRLATRGRVITEKVMLVR